MNQKHLILYLKGMLMGIADLVPGVSGGTIALVVGIYEELIHSLNQLRPQHIRLLFTSGWKSFWTAINGNFLLSVFGGIITSIIAFSYLINWLYTVYQPVLFAFFLGVLLSSFLLLRKNITAWNSSNYLALVLGAAIAIGIAQLAPSTGNISLLYLFFCGSITISAMLLPGLSGAYLLLLLGAYQPVINALSSFFGALATFDTAALVEYGSQLFSLGIGVILGLLLFSGFLKWCLHNYYAPTLSLLLGLMLGASYIIWPWQNEVQELQKGATELVWPNAFNSDPQLLATVIAFCCGVALLFALEKFLKPAAE